MKSVWTGGKNCSCVKENCCEEFLEQTENRNEWLTRRIHNLLDLCKENADITSRYS
jgi:hypothetical protein